MWVAKSNSYIPINQGILFFWQSKVEIPREPVLSLILIILYGSSSSIRGPCEAYTCLLLIGQHLNPLAHDFLNGNPSRKISKSSHQEQSRQMPRKRRNSGSKTFHSKDFEHEAYFNKGRWGFAAVRITSNIQGLSTKLFLTNPK